jgi:hypothetical protein
VLTKFLLKLKQNIFYCEIQTIFKSKQKQLVLLRSKQKFFGEIKTKTISFAEIKTKQFFN